MEKKQRPDYVALVDRIAAGEITRAEAAQLSGAPNTFLSWVNRSGAAERLRPVRLSAGANHWNATTDPDKVAAYDEALTLALTGRVSVRAAARQFAGRGVSYGYLLRKYNKASAERAARAAVIEEQAARVRKGVIEEALRHQT